MDLRKELIDFEKWIMGNHSIYYKYKCEDLVDYYLKSIHSMSECERQPVGNNKQCDNDFYCEWENQEDFHNDKCEERCYKCKTYE